MNEAKVFLFPYVIMAASSNWTVKNTRSKFLQKVGKIGSADGAPDS